MIRKIMRCYVTTYDSCKCFVTAAARKKGDAASATVPLPLSVYTGGGIVYVGASPPTPQETTP